MIFRLFINKDCEEAVTAMVHERTPLVDEIERLVIQDGISDKIMGYDENEIVMLAVCDIDCFYVESNKTYAHCIDNKSYLIKKRLYELENMITGDFVKINKSALANWAQVFKLQVQFSGAVDVIFKSGYRDCISRRCFADLKRRYGL